MFEWLDGYWTGMRHASAANLLKEASPSWLDWATALGSVIAGIGATAAAVISLYIARRARLHAIEDALERERVDVFNISREQRSMLTHASLSMAIERQDFYARKPVRQDSLDNWKDFIAEFDVVIKEHQNLADASELRKPIMAAKKLSDLRDIRLKLADTWDDYISLDKQCRGLKYRATNMFLGEYS